MILVLDAHVIVWAYTKPQKLTPRVRALLDDHANAMVVPVIALSEVEYLARRTGSTFTGSVAYGELSRLPNCLILPYTVEIMLRIPPQLEMHDGIIVATTKLIEDITQQPAYLITADAQIQSSGLVEWIWN